MDYKLYHAQHSHVPGIYHILLLSISGHVGSKFLVSVIMLRYQGDLAVSMH